MYKVTKRYQRGPESTIGNYKTRDEADRIIQENLNADHQMRVPTTYGLYELGELIKEYTEKDLIVINDRQDTSSQKGSGQSFNPSPLNTAPRPTGMPQSGWKDDKNEDEKK